MTTAPVIFWQRMLSPHMAALASALARQGVEVHYCAETTLSPERQALGWSSHPMPAVTRHEIPENRDALVRLIEVLPQGAVHLGQGLLRNGRIGTAQHLLRQREARQWLMLEQVNDRGISGIVKRIQYGFALGQARHWAEHVLAIGSATENWLGARGLPRSMISPFAYFLDPMPSEVEAARHEFSILFVGRLVPLKRLDLLIAALGSMEGNWRLKIIGDGPQARILKSFAARNEAVAARIDWLGIAPQDRLSTHYAEADLLVLPSDYDGWGAVASEALIAGCRVLVSDACGCAAAVSYAPGGRTFRAGSLPGLEKALSEVIDQGPVSHLERQDRAAWARCLNADAGADYLIALLSGERLPPPWERAA